LCALPSRVSLRLVRRLAGRDGAERPKASPTPEQLSAIIVSVSRFVPRATCLTQAIAAQLLLKQRGYASKLCVGVVRSRRGGFTAHAWVERQHRILIGGAESANYVRLTALNGAVSPRSDWKTHQ
jgi:hypothetical protein